ncbi:succinate-semialdehyde dehydrogenase (NADP+) [Cryptococcus gattii Ru294]|nr:succinate-semialdehyde dehydrogenase (NADP+) [Cryptococcus gattii Ru294]
MPIRSPASLSLKRSSRLTTATRRLHTSTPTLIAAASLSKTLQLCNLQLTPHLLAPNGSRTMSNWPKVTSENPLGLDDPTLFIQKGLINGQYVGTKSGKTFDVNDPASGKTIGTCPEMTVEDTRHAIEVAEKAFATFRNTSPAQRSNWLSELYRLYQASIKDIARLIVWENGKSWNDAMAEATYAGSFFSWFAAEALRTYGEVIPCSVPGTRNFSIKQPIGVVALLCPWNFPAAMIARKMGPALAVGCTSVIKTPSETPFTTLAIIELARRAGIPDGVLNVITTDANLQDVGKELCTNPAVHKVSFTGSTRVGKILASQCSSTLKKMSLELGGNAPLIVFEDADIPTAIAGTIASKFRGSGQTCVCANRIYVHDAIYDEFAKKLAEKVAEFKVGPGFGEGVTHGPLIHARQADKVEEHVQDAVKKGAKILVGGKRGNGTEYIPTVLTDVNDECLIATEETFGPVAALFRFSSEEEVVARANAAEVGLAGYFFSRDSDRIWRVAEALETGMVGANTGMISQAVIPFGGIKESGYGKEGGRQGTDEYTITKFVAVGTSLHNMPK